MKGLLFTVALVSFVSFALAGDGMQSIVVAPTTTSSAHAQVSPTTTCSPVQLVVVRDRALEHAARKLDRAQDRYERALARHAQLCVPTIAVVEVDPCASAAPATTTSSAAATSSAPVVVANPVLVAPVIPVSPVVVTRPVPLLTAPARVLRGAGCLVGDILDAALPPYRRPYLYGGAMIWGPPVPRAGLCR